MSYPTARSPWGSTAAACILSGGLIAAAIIDSHKTVTYTPGPPTEAAGLSTSVAPPISQEAAAEQFRTQMLASDKAHAIRVGNSDCSLGEVKVTNVIYTPKDDTYTIGFDASLQPAGACCASDSHSVTLSSDGFRHYYGSVMIGTNGNANFIDVTIR